MQSKFSSQNIHFHHADCLKFIQSLATDSIDLVLTDPPYYKVKADDWDNQWQTKAEFLEWLERVIIELCRVLKPSGSLFLFCSSKHSADVEILIRNHMNVLNHIVWAKERGIHQRACKEQLRAFFPASERIIFAENNNSEPTYSQDLERIRRTAFAPITQYFMKAREAAGVSAKAINEATGTQMCSHWFSFSQWSMPSETNYKKLQKLFIDHGLELGKTYDSLERERRLLSKDYQELKREAEGLRRPFRVTKETPYTDVWRFNSVAYYQGKHPCQKPDNLLQHMINSTSREGGTVLDVFAGSGSTLWNAANLNRKAIGCEADSDIFNHSVDKA